MSTTEPIQKRVKKVLPTCQICAENFNKSTRLPIECPYCQFESCRSCCETYILSESDVKCMNPECGKTWTRKMIRNAFTLVFINGALKDHKERILFDKERALMPATQPIIEGKILAKEIEKELREIKSKIHELQREEVKLITQKNAALNRKTGERTEFIRKCPGEECRGFLSTQWKCGICEKWTCPDCHIIKGYTRDAEHECKPDDIATAKLLSTDTKPCPKCSTPIFKIDGCDQMWCTQCHTAFSWRTGRLETNIHNPHYNEWVRRNNTGQLPRNPLDIPCGRNLDYHLSERFHMVIRGYYHKSKNGREITKRVENYIRRGMEIYQYERPTIHNNYTQKHENLRVAYLMKEITEEYMRNELQRDDKRHSRNQELAEVYTLLNNTLVDILYRFLDELQRNSSDPPEMINDSTLNEIDRIIDYVNECLADISHTYSCSKTVVLPDLRRLKGHRATEYLRNNISATLPLTNEFV
jgi:hypothetical protein